MYQDGGSFAEGYAVGRDVNNGYGNGNGLFGGDWAAWIIILLIFGWGGNNGFGGNGFGNGGGNMLGYELGKLASTNDVASGFSTSAIMSDLNDILLGQAGIQQTLCQGFSGVNATVNTVGNQINQGICNLGYTIQGGFNGLGHQISDCCCDIKTMLLENRYLNERQTCDIVQASNANTQRIVDFLTNEKISSLQAENATLTAQLSQNAQTRTLIDTLKPCPVPAYITCSPYQSIYGFPTSGYGFNNNGCCGNL